MRYVTIFHLISSIFKKANVSGVLIGGFAVNYYKVTRQTVDVDFLINERGFEGVKTLLERQGYKVDFAQKVFTRFKSSSNNYLMDIDFMFVDKDTLSKIIESGKKITIAKQEFIVPSLNNLIALKLHSLKYNYKLRENKDLPDIIELIRNNKLNYNSKKFKDLCLKYGTKGIYNKILSRL